MGKRAKTLRLSAVERKDMKILGAFLLAFFSVVTHAQTDPNVITPPPKQPTLADFGIVYPLSEDWIRATQLMRNNLEASKSLQGMDVLLAAVYVPKSTISTTSPFFTLFATQQQSTDCKGYLEGTIAHSQGDKSIKMEGGVVPFSSAGRDYYRIAIEDRAGPHHRAIICAAANNHLLLWNAGAANSKGLDAVFDTLNAITPSSPPAGEQAVKQAGAELQDALKTPVMVTPSRIRISSGVISSLLIKKVNPIYPSDARQSYIQGTVVFRVQISKAGDITELELLSGPIELAGSAANAVRQWKYRPNLLNGKPVMVDTQIQVNYTLSR
jgi:TonB family protein